MAPDRAPQFSGDVASVYEPLMVPMLFQDYADDLVRRLAELTTGDLLELAAGTGVVTRALAASLPPSLAVTATDLSPAMIDGAAQIGTARPVSFRPADASALPFDEASFDAVVCQFGVMFFPCKPGAFAEARRVLRPSGRLVLSTWDGLDTNGFAAVIDEAVGRVVTGGPADFMRRTPHGYYDVDRIRADVRGGGFDGPIDIDVVAFTSRAATAESVARPSAWGLRSTTSWPLRVRRLSGTPRRRHRRGRGTLRGKEVVPASAEIP